MPVQCSLEVAVAVAVGVGVAAAVAVVSVVVAVVVVVVVVVVVAVVIGTLSVTECCLFVCDIVFMTRYMRPGGPWQRRAFLTNLFLPRTSSRRHSGASPPATLHPLKKRG